MQRAIQLFADVLHTAEVSGPAKATALVLQATTLPAKAFENFDKTWVAAVSLANAKKGVSIQSIAGVVTGSRGKLMLLAAEGNVLHDAVEAVKAIRVEIMIGGLTVLSKKILDAQGDMQAGMDPAEAMLSVTKLSDKLRAGLDEQSYGINIAEVMTQGLKAAQNVAKTGIVADIRSGIASLDEALGGGLRRKALHVFGFRTSDGKTTLGVQQAIRNAMAGKRSLLISLEMDAETLGERILVHETRRPWATLTYENKQATLDAYEKARDGWEAIKDRIIIVPDKQLDVLGIRMALLDTETKYGPVDVVIIDHAQIVEAPPQFKGARYQEVGGIARDLATMAKAENIAVVLFSQLNPVDPMIVAQKKKSKNLGVDPYEPSWAELRESKDLAMHAFSIILGWTSWDNDHPTGSHFKIEKARQAKRGKKVDVDYKPALFAFEDIDPDDQPEDDVAKQWSKKK